MLFLAACVMVRQKNEAEDIKEGSKHAANQAKDATRRTYEKVRDRRW